jgi:predicted ATP-grasp superfamily ATP-dependent carboligase
MVAKTATGAVATERASPGDQYAYDILILDAAHKQSLASARSLGRAGLRIALGESLAQYPPGLPLPAFRSRYCARSVVLPSYATDPASYAAAIIAFVREHPTRVVLPAGDATCVTLMPYRREFAALDSTLALPPDSALEIAFDKDRTLSVARELGIAYPQPIRIRGIEELSVAVAEFGFPFVLKPTVSWTGKTPDRVVPVEVVDKAEAASVTERFLAGESTVLAQPWVPGRREGVTLFIVGGEVLASCGHIEHRTTPPLGGASVVRESIAVPRDIYDPAVRLATTIGIEGVCEVEFRRDAGGQPLLMEINARLVGTLDNSIKSGADFPWLIWQWATRQPVSRVKAVRPGVRTRWLHGDLRWLRENQQRAGRPDRVSRAQGVWTFVSEFARTRHYDYFDLGDMGPAVAEMRYTAATIHKAWRQNISS